MDTKSSSTEETPIAESISARSASEVRQELHFAFSSRWTYSSYCSADMSLSTSSSEESFSLMSHPSPYGSSLTMPGSATARIC